jgi:transcriptional regulator with XRE-family HTH domain
MAIDQETRERAEELFTVDGLTLEEISGRLGVSDRTLANWSASGNWMECRKKHREDLANIKRNSFKLRHELAKKALETLENMQSINPQDMHGFKSVLSMIEPKEKEKDQVVADIDRPKLFLEHLEFIVSVLKEIDQEGLKVMLRNFDEITGRFKDMSLNA